jgi:hypothetical protein
VSMVEGGPGNNFHICIGVKLSRVSRGGNTMCSKCFALVWGLG